MGAVISKAANGIGGILGNVFAAPFRTILGGSCEDVCAGAWDALCFIEHLCISNLIKLVTILGLCYLTLLFFYLLFKVGICQCIGRSLCKMCWATCETYWFGLEYITCFLWHKLKNTKRVHRRRIQDIEKGFTSSSDIDSSDNYRHLGYRKRKSVREGRNVRSRSSRCSSSGFGSHSRRHRVRLKTKEISVHVKGGSRRLRNSRRLQLMKARTGPRNRGMFKRRRLR